MKRYLKQRFEAYKSVMIGLICGFIIITYLFERPDFKSVMIAIGIGLVFGELIVYPRWLRNHRKKENL